MADTTRHPVNALQPLLLRAKALPEFYQGYLDGHVVAAVRALETGLELCEAMAADKARKLQAAQVRRPQPLRLVRQSAGGGS